MKVGIHFITFANNAKEVAEQFDIFNKTNLMSPQKQYAYLAGLLMSTNDESNGQIIRGEGGLKKILHDFVQEEIADYSFTPPDRRYTDIDFFLPDFNEKDYTPKDILFMVDTSGSVSREELGRVYAEISGAIEQFAGKLNGKLSFFDCEVTEPISFESIDEMLSIVPYGGGGTSFEIIFEYIQEHLSEFVPAMIVIFTDGYARFPEKEAAMNIPVLWLISNDEVTPPWGKVGRVV